MYRVTYTFIIYTDCGLILSLVICSSSSFSSSCYDSSHNKNLLKDIYIFFCISQGHLGCIKEHYKQEFCDNDCIRKTQIPEEAGYGKIWSHLQITLKEKKTLNSSDCLMPQCLCLSVLFSLLVRSLQRIHVWYWTPWESNKAHVEQSSTWN